VPQTALIHIKHSTGVYRRWEKHITMVLVKVLKRKKGEVLIRSVDLQAGDEVAISGVPFLRMTEADLNSETIDYCSH
jgi:predicted nucleotide-binding protein (sugar kinase/HSP70/actin superfamily)